MPTYTVTQRKTTATVGVTGAALSRDAALAAAVQAATTGPTGTEGQVFSCVQIAASGPTGTFASSYNTTGPLTGATFSATSREDAVNQAVAAGPTGPGANLAISQVF